MTFKVLVDWKRPTVVPGLALWWRADYFQGLADGTAVTSWPSAVGSSTAIQDTGTNQPTKQTVDGVTCVRFDGTNDWLSLTGDALTMSQNKAGVSIFARAKVTPTAALRRIIYLSTGTSATAGRSALYIDTTAGLATGLRRLDADSAQGIIGSNPGSTNIRVMAGILDYANSDGFLYLDGTLDASSTTFKTSGNTSDTASQAAALGARGDGTAEFLGMDLYEVLVWPRVVTTDERTLIETYLSTDDLYSDVTDLVLRSRGGITAEYGRDQSTALAPTVSGRGQMMLNNIDRRFSPRNISSPLYGLIKPARPVTITRSVNYELGTYDDDYSDIYFSDDDLTTEYVIFHGHTDDTPINPDPKSKDVTVGMVDWLADFRGFNISTSLYQGIRTGEAIDVILDEVGWTGGRDLATGATAIPFWWEEGTDALSALEKLVQCEGPPAMLTIGADGSVVFRDRHHRLTSAPSITSQGTWRHVRNGVDPFMSEPFVYDDAWRNIINTGQISVEVRTPGSLEVVWTLESPLGFTASETKTFIATTSDPFINAQTPENVTDYQIISGSISTVSLSRVTGASTTITITAGGGGAQINGLQLRANLIQTAYTIQVAASDASSISDYGPRSFPGDLPFCNEHDAQAVINTAVDIRSQPLPVISTRFVIGQDKEQAIQILGRDLSDRVTVVEAETVLDDDFYIEQIAHDANSEYDHSVTVGLEAVPPDGAVTASNVFIIGGGVGHQIGDGVLAS